LYKPVDIFIFEQYIPVVLVIGKVTLEHAAKAQRGSRGLVLLFLNLGAR
jgi:hypothetical protein